MARKLVITIELADDEIRIRARGEAVLDRQELEQRARAVIGELLALLSARQA